LMMFLKLIGEKLANLCRNVLFTGAHRQTEHLEEKRERKRKEGELVRL
jgi:hypothetical protein